MPAVRRWYCPNNIPRVTPARRGPRLQRTAAGFRTAAGTALQLKVGLHCGPVAGAVIGTLRCAPSLASDEEPPIAQRPTRPAKRSRCQ
jgi:hypothetical protein